MFANKPHHQTNAGLLMLDINQLDAHNEILIQASYLYPDLITVISEVIREIIISDEQNDFISFSKISLNVDSMGINMVITTNQDFWNPEIFGTAFFRKDSLYYFLNSMAKNLIIRAKARGSRHHWKLRYGSSPEIEKDSVFCDGQTNGLIIEIDGLFFKLPVRNNYFLKEFDKSLVLLETDIKCLFMFYQSTYETNRSVIDFELSKELNLINLKKQYWGPNYNTIESLKLSFESLFITQKKLDMMDCVKIKVDNKFYTIEGFITAKGYPSQRYQLIYFDEKQLLLPKKWVQTYFNDLFSQQYGFSSSSHYNTKTVGNMHRTYPIIVLKIKTKLASLKETDLAESNHRFSRFAELREAQNPKKVRVLIILETIVNQFLKKLNLNSEKEIVGSNSNDYFDHLKNGKSPAEAKEMTKSCNKTYAKEALKNMDRPLIQSKTNAAISTETCIDVSKPLPKRVCVNVSALENCSVIGQVDKKFILTKLGNGTLLIFDQHAMDERIKLEQFIKDYLYSLKRGEIAKMPVEISLGELSDLEISLLEKYSDELIQLGFLIQITKKVNVYLKEIPTILFNKVNNDQKFILDGIWKHIFELEDMKKKSINIRKINDDSWWSEGYNIPSIMMDILKSNSCRQALMFGDEIEKSKCKELIQLLKCCNIPFFCAHGRPSMYPFVYKNSLKSSFVSDYYL